MFNSVLVVVYQLVYLVHIHMHTFHRSTDCFLVYRFFFVSPRNLFNIYKTYLISGVGALGDFTETVLLSPVTPVEANNGNGGLKAWGEWIKKYDISEEVKVLA